MARRHIIPALATCLLLPSCSLLDQRVDYTWFRDTFTPPQSDSVVVEAGSGLPDNAIPPGGEDPAALAPVIDTAPNTGRPQGAAGAAVANLRTYTVAKGDTLAAIARRHQCSIAELCKANGITDPDHVRIGQILKVPGKTGRSVAGTVAAATHRTTRAVHTAAQNGKRKFWQFWKKDAPAKPAAPRRQTYTVRSGDTINGIAHRYRIPPATLLKANRLNRAQADKIRIGQKLIIPINGR